MCTQSRPITILPVQPIAVEWVPELAGSRAVWGDQRPPAQLLTRRQIVENMPDPICPLFEELYVGGALCSVLKRRVILRVTNGGQRDEALGPWGDDSTQR